MNATPWIYNSDVASGAATPTYVTFNAPVGQPAAMQCGRAVFSDVHLSGVSDDTTFPNECVGADPTGAYATNEKALEFLFFDLSACVTNDMAPPPMPQPPPQ